LSLEFIVEFGFILERVLEVYQLTQGVYAIFWRRPIRESVGAMKVLVKL
jgi:hypothetical protein